MDKPETLTELVKSRSDWHFDPQIPENSYRGLAWFRGEWRESLKAFLTERDRAGDFATITLGSYSGRGRHTKVEEMEVWGYPPTQIFHHCMGYSAEIPFPTFVQKIIDLCGLDNPVAEIIRMRPGHILPPHADMHNTYHDKYGDNARVLRYVIALDDWDWGHYVGIGNSVWHQWRRGQAIYWPSMMYHCAANAGRRSLLLLTVTGESTSRALHEGSLKSFDVTF